MHKTLVLAALLFAALAIVSGADNRSFSQESHVVAPALPDSNDKDALVQYQKELEEWGAANVKTSDEFWRQTAEPFYESTKRILDAELDDEERVRYNKQMAGILGSFALQESLKSGKLEGRRFDELVLRAADASKTFSNDKSELAKDIYLAYARQFMNLRLQFAIQRPAEEREKEFVSLVGDAITLALLAPEYGEEAFQIVLTIRSYDRELGEDAIDALCDAFENSGEPKLVKPIQKTSGLRRYARLPGGSLYFEALFPDEKGEYTKKFEPQEVLGKVCLVEVWATWCGPCRKEIPRLKEVYERYHDAGFEILGYSVDQDLDALDRFVKENEIPWPVASQKRSVEAGYHGLYEYYSINGVPEMILVDRDGKVLQVDCRGVKLANALKELFPDVKPLDWDPANDFSARAQECDPK